MQISIYMEPVFILGHSCIHDLFAGVADSNHVGGYDYIRKRYQSVVGSPPPVYGIHSFSVAGYYDYNLACADFGFPLPRIPYTPLVVRSPSHGIQLMREFEWSNAPPGVRLNPDFVYLQDWYQLFQSEYSLKQYTGILSRF